MSQGKSITGWLPTTLITVVMLVGFPTLYLGAYYALIEPPVAVGGLGFVMIQAPSYRIGGDAAAFFFAPAHYIDRNWIRPAAWESHFDIGRLSSSTCDNVAFIFRSD